TKNYSELNQHFGLDDLSSQEPRAISALFPYLYWKSFDPQTGSQRQMDTEASASLIGSSISVDALQSSLLPSLNLLGNTLIQYIQENSGQEQDRWMEVRLAMKKEKDPYLGDTQDLGIFLSTFESSLFKNNARVSETKKK